MGEGRDALEVVRTALTMALDHNLTAAAAEIYQRLADSLEHDGDYPAARATYDDAVAFCTASGQEPTALVCLACLTAVLRQTGDWERAVVLCRQIIASPDAVLHARAVASGTLGSILGLRGEARRARPLLLEALSLARRIELTAMELLAGWGLALVDWSQGAHESASDRCEELLERWKRSGRPALRDLAAPVGDDVLRRVREREPELERARRRSPRLRPTPVWTRRSRVSPMHSARPRSWTGSRSRPRSSSAARSMFCTAWALPFERLESERRAASALSAAGQREEAVEHLVSAYRTARRLGARPTMERVAATLAELGEPVERRLSRLGAEQLASGGLTRRESEVVRLIAVGLTNREIAGELYLSPRTVDMHVRNILRKLDSRSRADAVRRAGELGLLGQAAAAPGYGPSAARNCGQLCLHTLGVRSSAQVLVGRERLRTQLGGARRSRGRRLRAVLS